MKKRRFTSLTKFLRDFEDWQAERTLRADPRLWFALQPILEKSASTGCTFYELATLYRHILQTRPAEVLELGSGISTVILGYAALLLRDVGLPCRITSMEESEHYFADLSRRIPDEIRNCIDLVHSHTTEREISAAHVAQVYVDVPKRDYERVFIDGPQIAQARQDATVFDGDILEISSRATGRVVAFLDGRIQTRDALKKLMPQARFTFVPRHRFTRIDIP